MEMGDIIVMGIDMNKDVRTSSLEKNSDILD